MASFGFIKRALLIAMVTAPAFWLLFTPEGQRYADLFILGVGGEPEIPIGFDRLHRDVTPEQLAQEQPDLELQCRQQASPFGEKLCHAPIAGFNGTPARHIIFYYNRQQLRAIKLGYQRSYHGRVVEQFRNELGRPEQSQNAQGATINRWPAGEGVVVMPKLLSDDQEPALMWVAQG